MELGLKDRVALVTGGARGIGAGIAMALAREGCDVAVADRYPPEPPDEVEASIREAGRSFLAMGADVRDMTRSEEVVGEVVETLGRLDILVCNAGISRDHVIWKMSEKDWDEVIGINLKGCFTYAKAAAPVFRTQGSGRIVNVSSINGLRGKFGVSNYAASKAGIIGLTKTLAKELGAFGVTVNAVAPGMVQTGLTESLTPEVLAAATAETVTGRLAHTEDVADLVVFLCSERASHITGEVVKVDGGQYI